MSIELTLWPIPTPPASALDVDLAPGIAVTLTPALAGAVVTASPGGATGTTDGGGEAWLATGNGSFTVSAPLTGYTIADDVATVLDASVDLAMTAVAVPPPIRTRTPRPVQLVHLRFRSGVTHYFSTRAYSDAGRRFYKARLLDWVSYERSVGCVLWDRQSRSAVGAIELANADGGLSALLAEDAEGAIAQIWECTDEDPIEAATLVGTVRVVSIDAENLRIVRILQQDPLAALDVPLQQVLYTAADGVEDDLVGTPKPVSIGAPLSVPLTLRDFGTQIYDVHDRRDDLVPAGMLVRDGGVEVSWSLAAAPYAGPELADRAIGQLVCDVATGAGTETVVIGAPLGDFVSDLAGWTIDADGGSVAWEAPGRARILGTAVQQPSLSAGSVTAGDSYSWSVTVSTLAEGALELLAGGERVALLDEAKVWSGDFVAGGAGPLLIRAASGTGNIGDTLRPAATDAAIDTVRLTRLVYGGTAADAIQRVTSRAGLEPDFVSISSLIALRVARPWQVAYYAGQAVQARDVVRAVLDSVLGWAYSLPDGRIALGVLQPPDEGPVKGRILRTQWLSGPTTPRDTAPGLAAAIAGRRNWRPYTASELADDPAIDPIRAMLTADCRTRRAVPPVSTELGPRKGEMTTLLSDSVDVEALADLLPELYPPTARPRFVTGELPRQLARGWLPGDRIVAEIPSGPEVGCRLIGTVVQRHRARVTLWGWF